MRPAYREVRLRVRALAAGLDVHEANLPVPACPGWTVRELISHIVGVASDVARGTVDGAASDAWTAAQVDGRRERSILWLLGEWDAVAEPAEVTLGPEASGAERRFLIDTVTHEADLRGALRRPRVERGPAFDLCVQTMYRGLRRQVEGAHLAPLTIRTDDDAVPADGETGVTLEISRFDLFRACMGRRSIAQMRAFQWSGDPSPYLPLIPYFPPPVDDLIE